MGLLLVIVVAALGGVLAWLYLNNKKGGRNAETSKLFVSF
jgi:hypothetical protein